MTTHTLRGLLFACVALMAWSAGRADEAEDKLKEEALSLNKVTGQKAIEDRLKLMIQSKDQSKKLVTLAGKMLKEKDTNFNYNGAFMIGTAAIILDMPTEANDFLRHGEKLARRLQSPDRLLQVYGGLIDLHMTTKKYSEVVKVCDEFLKMEFDDVEVMEKLDKAKPTVMEKKVQALSRDAKTDEALKLVDKLIDRAENPWYFVRLKGEVYRDAKKFNDSAKAYLEAIAKLEKSDLTDKAKEGISRRIRYTLSGVYVDAKDIDKGIEQLELLEKADPSNPTYKNDLGFILCDNDRELPRAEKLIRKALELDRADRKELDLPKELDHDNPSYLDSLGWVLYKLGKYKEAVTPLEEAIKYDAGKHVEVYDHLADVYMKLEEKAKAIKIWEEALKLENLSWRDDDRKESIKKKLAAAKK